MTDVKDNAGVWFPPPLIYVLALGLAWAINARAGPVGLDSWPRTFLAIGTLLVLLGFALILWAFGNFRRAGTAILPVRSTTQIVERGPYVFTRNPMYLGMTAVYTGIALAFALDWAVILLPGVLAVVYLYVIRKEERYLSAKFGQEYLDYKKRVRRWI